MTGSDTFPASLDQWTDADWDEYADRIARGEGSVRVFNAINRRRSQSRELTGRVQEGGAG
ncbi:hypothetical protein ACFV42_46455 [Streptomyces solisilvae]|uniref:hypothetical protein n=1 Tax=Streptomyces malaysiensis TaxID=92644 RepID=UPI0036A6969D